MLLQHMSLWLTLLSCWGCSLWWSLWPSISPPSGRSSPQVRHCTACCHAGSSAVALSLPTACSLCRKRPGGFLRQVELHSSTHMLLMGSLSAAMTAPSVTKPAAISAVLWLPPGVTPAVCTGHTAPSHCASDAPFGADACKPGSCCCLHGRARSHIDCTACQTQHAPCPAVQAPCRCCPCSCCLAQPVWLTTKGRILCCLSCRYCAGHHRAHRLQPNRGLPQVPLVCAAGKEV